MIDPGIPASSSSGAAGVAPARGSVFDKWTSGRSRQAMGAPVAVLRVPDEADDGAHREHCRPSHSGAVAAGDGAADGDEPSAGSRLTRSRTGSGSNRAYGYRMRLWLVKGNRCIRL